MSTNNYGIHKDATHQEVFDKVFAHLLKQNRRSIAGSTCAYRDERGGACAAGCVISDKEYNPQWEGKAIWGLIDDLKLPNLYRFRELLRLAQDIHDKAPNDNFRHYVVTRGRHLAEGFKLDTKVLDAA